MRRAVAISLAVVCLAFGACSTDEARAEVLTIYAASSLTDAFLELERAFEADHPGVDVRMVFAGSQTLRMQIEHGADADVFASADPAHVIALEASGRIGGSIPLATNTLVVAVPTSNPAGISAFADLDRAESLVVGTSAVPVGSYTREMLAQARTMLGDEFVRRVLEAVVSEESNTRLVLSRAAMNEVDAVIVYHSDTVGSHEVTPIPIPDSIATQAIYRIGVRPEADALAEEWLAFVTSDGGRQVLAAHGFGLPDE